MSEFNTRTFTVSVHLNVLSSVPQLFSYVELNDLRFISEFVFVVRLTQKNPVVYLEPSHMIKHDGIQRYLKHVIAKILYLFWFS